MNDARPNALEIWKQLERSNCGECGVPTCMAFAALVVRGGKRLEDCPRLAPDVRKRYEGRLDSPPPTEEYGRELMEALMAHIQEVDFAKAAARLGGTHRGDRLAIHCLGRIFELDGQGRLYSQCHVNPWIHVPLLEHVLESAGRAVTGEWLTFAELGHTADWVRFYEHRCEQGFRQLADREPQLFADLLQIFGAVRHPNPGNGRFADGAVVIRPLPKVPVLFSYWPAEGDFSSKLTLFFDRSAEQNLPAESLYRLTQGLVEMFKKIYLRHSGAVG